MRSIFCATAAVVKAMKQWRFAPGLKDGNPVAVRDSVERSFTLKIAPSARLLCRVRMRAALDTSPAVWYFTGSGRAGIAQW